MLKRLLACALLIAVGGCGRPQTVEAVASQLQHHEASERAAAARKLRTEYGVPLRALPDLLAATVRESELRATREMLLTLGTAGVPEAWPVIAARLAVDDPKMQYAARRALVVWFKANGQDYDMDDLPRGVPGTPPVLVPLR